jgi:glycosyltransferase involved in cell wall biosynthesis
VAGRRPEEEVSRALARAGCLATASEREGYGLVVVEAAVHGTPSVVVAGPENAATELVEQGVNGAVAPSAVPGDLAAAILDVLDRGVALRSSTARWFEDNAGRLRLDRSLQLVLDEYEGVGLGGPPSVEREWRRPA